MSLKETAPKPIKLKKKALKQDAKHPFTAEKERKADYIDHKISEYFKMHGTPSPTELNAVTRTLTAVFSGDYSRENSHNKPPKQLKDKR